MAKNKGDVSAQKRRYYEKYRERINLQQREYRLVLKQDAIDHYGICPCGENRPDVLEIDHINEGGQDHRREIVPKHGRVYMPAWLKKNNYPPGYQMLCRLCHDKKGGFVGPDFTVERAKAYARKYGRPRYQYLLDPE